MHQVSPDIEALADSILTYAMDRLRMDPPSIDHPLPQDTLEGLAGQTITEEGLGGDTALKLFIDTLAPACISEDHPRYLAFVPTAPSEVSTLFDLVVGASNICASSWLEGAGAIYAENQALRWISDIAGFPAEAGGVFVSGGTAGNLSALVAARHDWRQKHPEYSNQRGLIISSRGAHASVEQAAHVMDADLVQSGQHQLTGADVADTLAGLSSDDRARVFAVACTAGTTNLGIIDDMKGIGEVCKRESVWLHVDGAYGGAALAAPSTRPLFDGIEQADSFIVDPHKWLFAPFDCCALIYAEPAKARQAHRQHGDYLEVFYDGIWNPSDYAHHLSRRARGLPFWFSLAVHGTKAYAEAVETTLDCARDAAEMITAHPHLELVTEQRLSICVFRRIGWTPEQYKEWSDALLERGDGLVTPTKHEGETVLRFCIVNPRTTQQDIRLILDTL